MMRQADWAALVLLLVAASLPIGGHAASAQAPSSPGLRWFKGNTHTHTINSDGDSTPDDVVRWYREQRYHFIVLTDHNFVTPVDGLNALHAADGRFLVIAGEEITDRAGDKPVHVNALGPARAVAPAGGTAPGEAVSADVEAARGAGGLPQVNHPNFGWALGSSDLLAVKGVHLLEIFNGHPQVNNAGGGGSLSAEALWDELLSAGRTVFGVASDDLHDVKRAGLRQAAGPGRGWVMVRAQRLAAADILAALERGDFYATTGVELRDVQATPRAVAISVREQGTTRFRIEFVGREGRVLKAVDGATAAYEHRGGEGYVRARVTDSNGLIAWTQPVRLDGSRQETP